MKIKGTAVLFDFSMKQWNTTQAFGNGNNDRLSYMSHGFSKITCARVLFVRVYVIGYSRVAGGAKWVVRTSQRRNFGKFFVAY